MSQLLSYLDRHCKVLTPLSAPNAASLDKSDKSGTSGTSGLSDASSSLGAEEPVADLIFYRVAAQAEPDADTLRALMSDHPGEFTQVSPLDGAEHSFIELGGWLGSQDLALKLMGLGTLLGLWKLLTPRTMLGSALPDELVQQLAGNGLVTVMAPPAA